MKNRVKIVCTIGPASEDQKTLKSMMQSGMDAARLNFSHGTHESHGLVLQRLRAISNDLQNHLAVIQDLQGIKIRITDVDTPFRLTRGDRVIVLSGTEKSTRERIYIDYPHLLEDLKKGDRILIDDGLVCLMVKDKTPRHLVAVVKEGGVISSRKGVNLPDTKISLSPFTDKDRADLSFGLQMGIDYVAMSFVTSHKEIVALKDWIARKGHTVAIIAKIERPEALTDIDRILDVSDGIMIARGDLGVEMPPEEVPLIQKELILKANTQGKLVITATQMLESMKQHARPTRAEVADVANAVIDGSDALMLSAETSTGNYPVLAVRMMRRIITTTERKAVFKNLLYRQGRLQHKDNRMSFAVADAAVRAAEDIKAKFIVALTESGYTARIISKLRPHVPVVAFTPRDNVLRLMKLFWGVTPMKMQKKQHWSEMFDEAVNILQQRGLLKRSDRVVVIGGDPPGQGMTNILKIITVD